jgi:Secretion system C-terminal sorting domain
MRNIYLVAVMAMISTLVYGQNIITNPGLESGSIPNNHDQVNFATGWSRGCGTFYCSTCSAPAYAGVGSPDLFDGRSTNSCYDFTNKWSPNLPERTGGNRYVGFSGGSFSSVTNSYYFGETVIATINSSLIANCPYTISFYAAKISAVYNCAGTLNNALGTPNPTYNKIEVVLRKANDCTTQKSVFLSAPLNNSTWTQYSGQFTLTAAEAAVGYDRIEFRYMAIPNLASNTNHRLAFLDDVSLVPGNTPISPDFTLTATNPSGNQTSYIVTATVSSVPAGSGFAWEVTEVDVNTGAVIPGTSMGNPSNWWASNLYYTNSFPGYCCNTTPTTGNGTFLLGHKYRITRGTWGPCTAYTTVTKTVFMDIVMRTNGGAMQPVIETITDYKPEMPQGLMDDWANRFALSESNFKIYPNPTESQFTVESAWGDREFSVTIIDALGKTYMKFNANEPYTVVDLSAFESGIYFVRFAAGDHVETQKLIKR